jgi:hypothetical protein
MYQNSDKFSIEEIIKYPKLVQFYQLFTGAFYTSTKSIIDYLVLLKFRYQGDKITETDFKEINEFLEHWIFTLKLGIIFSYGNSKTLIWRQRLHYLLKSENEFLKDFIISPNYFLIENRDSLFKSIYFWLNSIKSDNTTIDVKLWIHDIREQTNQSLLNKLDQQFDGFKKQISDKFADDKNEPADIYEIFNSKLVEEKLEIFNEINLFLMEIGYISKNNLTDKFKLNFPNKESSACAAIYYCLVKYKIIEGYHNPKLLQKLFLNWFQIEESKSLNRILRDTFKNGFGEDQTKKEVYINKIEPYFKKIAISLYH